MATLSFVEKLLLLIEMSKSSVFFIISIVLLLMFGIILITTNRKNAKSSRKLFALIYLGILTTIVILYKDCLSNIFKYFMENLFIVIYFPNLAIYVAAMIITTIILWFSVFNFKTPNIIKGINVFVYLIMNYLLIVLLSIINSQELDVFSQTSVYSSQKAQAIIELSSTVFVVWVIFLILYKGIFTYLTRDNIREKYTKKNISKNRNKKLPANINELPTPYTVKVTKTATPTIKRDNEVAMYDNLLTIDDYKLLLNMLREKKEQDRQEAVKKEREEKQLSKYKELQDLYGVR